MERRKNLKLFRNFILLILIILLGIFSYYLILAGFDSPIEKKVTYSEKSDIDYKVYYFENSFFDRPYLDKDKTYISSLIDNIDIDFNYKTEFDELCSGEYTYYINGTINAKNPSNEDEIYWTRTINIVEPKIIDYNGKKIIDFSENIKINYQLYNNLLKEFKSEYNLAFKGDLKIELFVESTNQTNILSKPIKINSVSKLNIPLTEQTINLSVISEGVNEEHEILEEEQLIDIYDKMYIISGSTLLVISITLLCIWFKIIRQHLKSQSEYNKERRKILKTYNSIIVNVKTIPKLNDINIINVENFEELIDAQSEVRMPINYIEEKYDKICKFILIGDNMAWIYTLINEEKVKK